MIGEKVKEARLKKGLTQLQLAQKLGIDQGRLSLIENGKVGNLKMSTIQKICKTLKIRICLE